jgi:hypothetical protein
VDADSATRTIATIGAITGSIGAVTGMTALAWDLYKWKHAGPKLKATLAPGMTILNPPPIVSANDRFICVTVRNTGHSKTTITHLAFSYFPSKPNRKLDKPTAKHFFQVPPPFAQQVPFGLEAGGEWSTYVKQNGEVETLARSGYLYARVYHTMKDEPLSVRVIISDRDMASGQCATQGYSPKGRG